MTPLTRVDQRKRRAPRTQARLAQAESQYATLLNQNPLPPADHWRIGKRAAIYLRQSRDSNLLGEGVDRQYEHCWARAKADDLDVVKIYIDNDLSARSKSVLRPNYAELVEALRRGEIDVVLCITQDRLLRRPRDMEDLIDIADERAFQIHGVLEPILDLSTAAGRRSARELVNYAAFEGDRRTERQLLRNAQSAQAGRTPHQRCVGYAPVKKGGIWYAEVVPEEAVIVSEIFNAAASGFRLSAVVHDLNARKVPHPAGGEWNHNRIRVVIRNRRYLGERWHQGEYVGPGDWQPLVTSELFEAAHEALESFKYKGEAFRGDKSIARKYLGTGTYLCGVCRGDVIARHTIAYKTRVVAYECRAANTSHIVRKIRDVDPYVINSVAAKLAEDGTLDTLLESVEHAEELAVLRREEADLMRRLKRAQDDYADELIDGQLYRKITTQSGASLESTRARMGELGGRSPIALLADADDPVTRFLEAPVSMQSAVVAAIADIVLLKATTKGRRAKDWKVTDVVRIDWKL